MTNLQNENSLFKTQVKLLENQLQLVLDVHKLFIEKIKQKDEIIINNQTEEIQNLLQYILKQEDQIKNVREKKKNYKKRWFEQCQLLDRNQNDANGSALSRIIIKGLAPIAQLVELRQMIVQLRLQSHLLPLMQAQVMMSQFQNDENISYSQNYDNFFEPEVSNGLSRQEIKLIRKKVILAPERLDMCAVCQTDTQEGDVCRRLSCNHQFHAKCIKVWLLHSRTCPLCKIQVSLPS